MRVWAGSYFICFFGGSLGTEPWAVLGFLTLFLVATWALLEGRG